MDRRSGFRSRYLRRGKRRAEVSCARSMFSVLLVVGSPFSVVSATHHDLVRARLSAVQAKDLHLWRPTLGVCVGSKNVVFPNLVHVQGEWRLD
jgi:hypothetical protein